MSVHSLLFTYCSIGYVCPKPSVSRTVLKKDYHRSTVDMSKGAQISAVILVPFLLTYCDIGYVCPQPAFNDIQIIPVMQGNASY